MGRAISKNGLMTFQNLCFRPPAKVARDGKSDRALTYQRIAQSLDLMKECLASGLPFVFGISVYDSFENQDVANTGVVPMPSTSEQFLGGHALICYGFRDSDQTFQFRNSWGSKWGLQGNGRIPYDYLLNSQLASDFWCVQSIRIRIKGDTGMDAKTKNILLIFTIVFLFLVECSALFIASWDTLNNLPVPSGASAVISAGLTYAVTALGINHGSVATMQGVKEGVSSQSQTTGVLPDKT